MALGNAAVCRLAGLIAASVIVGAVLVGGAEAAAPNPIQVENANPGSPSWFRTGLPGGSQEHFVYAYASSVTVGAGDLLQFHVQTDPAARYRVEIYRLGWYGGVGARLEACIPSCTGDKLGVPQPIPAPDAATGEVQPGWPVTDEITVPSSWISGYYMAEFALTAPGKNSAYFYPFIVHAPPGSVSPILVQVPVNTWQAYNDWGGKSLYSQPKAVKVSFDRPYARPFYYTQSPLLYEYPLVRFLEREGYDVTYQTDVDTHRRPSSLLQHRLVIVAGHDEYWSRETRDAFDRARNLGTNLAFLGANIGFWQVRYENAEHTMVGYKSATLDPEPNPALKTVLFRDLIPARPECKLMGVQYSTFVPDVDEAFPINPRAIGDPWFAGTGFDATTTLPHFIGYEWDDIQPACPLSPKATVLFHFQRQGGLPSGDAVRYIAPSGARVFSAGTNRFSWGLDGFAPQGPPDFSPQGGQPHTPIPGLQVFMRNALSDMTRPSPPLSLVATAGAKKVTLTVRRGPDPRILRTIVTRSGKVVCSGLIRTCVDRNLSNGHTYTYQAVNVDRWATSAPLRARASVRPVRELRAIWVRG
jgi:hypothetical protein